MKGDRERCLEVGMDDYISKPLQPADLFEAIERQARPSSEHQSSEISAQQTDQVGEADAPAFDKAAALQIVQGDEELLLEIIDIFLNTECPPLMSRIRNAIEQGDADGLCQAAHSLKGAASNLGATVAVAAARQLESIGRENDVAAAPQAFDALELALSELKRELEAFQNEASA
jgi:HPt (histidine-containing phosphotransfer) domain-containing protein